MQSEIKQRIHALVESIEDEVKLQLLLEDVEAYMDETIDEDDDLTDSEMEEIDESLTEMENGKFISWEDLQKNNEGMERKMSLA